MKSKIIHRLRTAANYAQEVESISNVRITITVLPNCLSIRGCRDLEDSEGLGAIRTSTRTITWEYLESKAVNPLVIEIVRIIDDLMPPPGEVNDHS